MKYSVIICYRNRLEHLKILAPRLREVFGDTAEIIVVEQNNNERFQRGAIFNVGAQIAKGEILVFHDVDHYPTDSVSYDPAANDLLLPVKRVVYVRNDLTEKSLEEVPSGYRHFKDGVDADFFGGVEVFKREAFFKINGFNTLYRGWGLEDADLRERVKHYALTGYRGPGTFYALDHADSFPGVQDNDFQKNQQIFMQWKDYLDVGVNTQFQTLDEIKSPVDDVDRWVQATNISVVSKDMQQYTTVDRLTAFYEDTPEKHIAIWTSLKALVNEHDELREHRNWVIANNFGYGNRAFHWMWNIIVAQLPRRFKFLEIGVYMGQIVSLISMMNKAHKKGGLVYGLTPLNNTGDKFSKHPEINYEQAIQRIYAQFKLDGDDLQIIEGLSTTPGVIETARAEGPYDVVYIDGGHDYDVVLSDLKHYPEMLKVGGLLVVDDASSYLKIPDGLIRMNWRGIEDVSNAVRDTIEKDSRFKHLFAVGHNRVWKRT